jgi:hypothetical protein
VPHALLARQQVLVRRASDRYRPWTPPDDGATVATSYFFFLWTASVPAEALFLRPRGDRGDDQHQKQHIAPFVELPIAREGLTRHRLCAVVYMPRDLRSARVVPQKGHPPTPAYE